MPKIEATPSLDVVRVKLPSKCIFDTWKALNLELAVNCPCTFEFLKNIWNTFEKVNLVKSAPLKKRTL